MVRFIFREWDSLINDVVQSYRDYEVRRRDETIDINVLDRILHRHRVNVRNSTTFKTLISKIWTSITVYFRLIFSTIHLEFSSSRWDFYCPNTIFCDPDGFIRILDGFSLHPAGLFSWSQQNTADFFMFFTIQQRNINICVAKTIESITVQFKMLTCWVIWYVDYVGKIYNFTIMLSILIQLYECGALWEDPRFWSRLRYKSTIWKS